MNTKTSPIDVSFVIPCLNEEGTITSCVKECFEALKDFDLKGEVIVADNGSTDNTRSKALSTGAKVIDVGVKGYGSALQSGISAASAPYVFFADADMMYDFKEVGRFLKHIKETGAHMVIGCRMPRGGGSIDKGAMPFLNQYLGNPVLSGIARLFLRVPVSDFHCGMRLIDKKFFKSLGALSLGMEFATEMVVVMYRKGAVIKELPIRLRVSQRTGGSKSKLRPVRDGLRHLHTIATLFFRR